MSLKYQNYTYNQLWIYRTEYFGPFYNANSALSSLDTVNIGCFLSSNNNRRVRSYKGSVINVKLEQIENNGNM
ncbi:16888_t:CDS:2 [Dentiscutata erythropus]|uniref:16888_t:CDS:1 n=1 Tax=Dentiscutata erythropus TaxID=1348616 RepID=A0A9N8Z8Y2_9GLOM|nr:16888_t:CDS:2 [Dentiscutata erythropus]